MKKKTLLSIARGVLVQPTAPFHEYYVRDEIIRRLAKFPNVKFHLDDYGNVIARYQKGNRRARIALGSHMDHPGWVKPPGKKKADYQFLGGVPKEYLKNPDIEKFGEFGMWNLKPFKVKKNRIYGRACDDLIGCSAILGVFSELERLGVECTCYGLFTRSEEVGFVGAVEMAKQWKLPKSVTFVSLETSTPAGGARMGKGPILRVGDRLSIFDSELTLQFSAVAKKHEIPVQRCLLDLGACEATAMQAYNIPSAGISVPLGNYHNCGKKGKIKAEYVDIDDVNGMVDVLVKTLECKDLGRARKDLKKRLDKISRGYRKYKKCAL